MYDTLQVRTYQGARQRAQEQLSNWTDTFIRLTNQGLTAGQIKRIRRTLELNSKGIFKS